ncbi:DDE-type integrase/transposase/recombinase [Robbsia andropogonis]|uniref:DDE-type integrase/transposase/recombinase n=1 Tax=Robbsia andropogonis TaxID=28092 RepID=UPI0004B681C3|nr:DDE-type integrase/transposase/recombinase [Robbsia andropogonis]
MTSFAKDEVLLRGEGKFRLLRVHGINVQLENVETAEITNHLEGDLLYEYVTGHLRTTKNGYVTRAPKLASVPASTTFALADGDAETRRRVSYLVELGKLTAFQSSKSYLSAAIKTVAMSLRDIKPPHCTTIYRWREKYHDAMNDLRALIDCRNKRGGQGRSRLVSEVEGVIHEKIETAFLNSKRGTAEDVYNAVFLELQRLNTTRIESEWLKCPSLRTVQRRVEALGAYEVAVARVGEKEARRRFADQFTARRVSRILELVEIDHTPMDIFYTDENGTAIARPMITVVFDRYSRCVLGFCMSAAGHGTHAVFEALRHSMMPKTYLKARFPHLDLEWPCYGWMERLLMDNGREFHGNAIVDALTNLGVVAEYAASKTPNDKPYVERFLKTLNYSFSHKVRGTTLAKIHERIGFNVEDEACVTFDKLQEMVHLWITTVYHLRPHRGLSGRAPLDVWKECAAVSPPVLKGNAKDLSIEFGKPDMRVLQHYGIDYDGFVYSSTELLQLRALLPEKSTVQFKAPYEDAGHIWIWNPISNEYIRANNKDERYCGLTVEQAKILRSRIPKADPYQRLRASAEETLREMSDSAMRSTKLKNRKSGARLAHVTSKQINSLTTHYAESKIALTPFTSDTDELREFDADPLIVKVIREK